DHEDTARPGRHGRRAHRVRSPAPRRCSPAPGKHSRLQGLQAPRLQLPHGRQRRLGGPGRPARTGPDAARQRHHPPPRADPGGEPLPLPARDGQVPGRHRPLLHGHRDPRGERRLLPLPRGHHPGPPGQHRV
ncbi:MAG: hypothetical protein AVDCRST_MAG68-607, partial [uncultured Gemmatimonadetes bacterium]